MKLDKIRMACTVWTVEMRCRYPTQKSHLEACGGLTPALDQIALFLSTTIIFFSSFFFHLLHTYLSSSVFMCCTEPHIHGTLFLALQPYVYLAPIVTKPSFLLLTAHLSLDKIDSSRLLLCSYSFSI